MLVTELSNAEIVLGKLAARLIPMLGLIAATMPVLAMAGLLGGIEPMTMLGLTLVAIGCAFLGGSLAMVLSIYGRKTHEVLMMAYSAHRLVGHGAVLPEGRAHVRDGGIPRPPGRRVLWGSSRMALPGRIRTPWPSRRTAPRAGPTG